MDTQDAADRSAIQPGKELGQSGTFLINGFLSGQDYAADMTGLSGVMRYDEMRKSDATVRVALMTIVLPILSAHWSIEPASESEQDQLAARFIDSQLLSGTNRRLSWRHFVEEAVKLQLAYGRMAYEKVFALAEFEGKQYIGWERFAPRHPRTIYRYAIGEDNRPGITQTLVPSGGAPEIPWAKLIFFVNEMEGENLEGLSVLRSAYKHWDMKKRIYLIQAIGLERQGLGVPYAQAKEGYTPSAKEQAKMVAALSNLRAGNEKAYLEIPAGYEIGWMDMKGHTSIDPKGAIDHHDRQIVKNVMAQFIEIGGTGSHGSLAASDNQMDLLILALVSVVNNFIETVQNMAISQLVDINWPGLKSYPKLRSDKIGPDNAAKLADILLKLAQGRWLTPTDEDEAILRDMLELPDLPDDMVGNIDRSPLPAAPGEQDASGQPQEPDADPSDQGGRKKASKPAAKQASEIARLTQMVERALYGQG